MANFKEDILAATGDEPILAFRFDSVANYYGNPDPRDAGVILGKVITWEQAAPLVDYEYDDGYGGQDCHNFTAWTETRVFSIHEYDGSTSVIWVDRNPAEAVK